MHCPTFLNEFTIFTFTFFNFPQLLLTPSLNFFLLSIFCLFQGAVHTLVEQVNGAMPNYSNNTKRSWMAIDLGGGRKLIPSRYCIR